MITQRLIFKLVCWFLLVTAVPAHADTYKLVTAPFEPFTDPNDPKGGFLVEVARKAFAHQGHDIEIEFHPWARAMKEAETGRYDGLLSAYYNEDRGKVFHFSAPLNTTQMVFVGLRNRFDTNHYETLDDLKPYHIATGRKWAYSEEFENRSDLKKEMVDDEPEGIHLLYKGRVDLFAVNIDQYRNAISKMDDYDISRTIIMSPAISTNDQHLAAPRYQPNTEKMLNAFNTGMAAIKANGTYNKTYMDFFGF
ncbi:MAG: transporter substrate-binding domain-containing protein [Methylocystaceae bacterium]|nr:transporter substrate-binding domain-containing protein [Methylocystaceae bacterium]